MTDGREEKRNVTDEANDLGADCPDHFGEF